MGPRFKTWIDDDGVLLGECLSDFMVEMASGT